MTRSLTLLAAAAMPVVLSPIALAQSQPATTQAKRQQVVLSETDPNSPRKSQLKGEKPSDEILRTDLDKDGDPDVLEVWWSGKRARWIDENDDMKPADVKGDLVDDAVQIDRDGDTYYDGPDDMNVKWVDDDGDRDPDVQLVAMHAAKEATRVTSGESHWMIFVDTDDDDVNGYIDWNTFHFANWHTTGPSNYAPDYNGNTIFLKEHLSPLSIKDPRYNWENPFAFYDYDGDGVSEQAIRFLDIRRKLEGGEETGWDYSGKVTDVYTGIDLDNDATNHNEMDFDMSFRYQAKKDGDAIDYEKYVNKHPKMKAPEWALPFFRYPNWRKIDEFLYVPHDKCYEEMFDPRQWESAWLSFDEDDDDHRWERVELYYPDTTEGVYSTKKWSRGSGGQRDGGMSGHPQADTLGDRGEWDTDFSGKGQFYVGRWDKKIHLHGAESGAWTVDLGGRYWGAGPVLAGASPERASRVEEVVQYKDTDNNGFFDLITFDYDGDKKDDLTVNLLEYKDGDKGADVAELHHPRDLKYEGMAALYKKLAEESFKDSHTLYRAAWKKGLTDTKMYDLSFASATGEKHLNGYWLKERVFRAVDKKLEGDKAKRDELRRAYFTGDYEGVVKIIEDLK